MHTATPCRDSTLRETLTPKFAFCIDNGAPLHRSSRLNWLNLALALEERGGCATAGAPAVDGMQQVRSSEDAITVEIGAQIQGQLYSLWSQTPHCGSKVETSNSSLLLRLQQRSAATMRDDGPALTALGGRWIWIDLDKFHGDKERDEAAQHKGVVSYICVSVDTYSILG